MKQADLDRLFQEALTHRATHQCGGYPYEYGGVLSSLVVATSAAKILELGTGLGVSTAYMMYGNPNALIDTIDQDSSHFEIAQRNWEKLGIIENITPFSDKAEAILPTLNGFYDFIFFDGYAPSMKFLTHFERLLKKRGILVTANLYLKDKSGGKYVRALKRERFWGSGFFQDTAISVKFF